MNNKKIANNSSSWMKQFEIITQHPKETRALFGCCCWFFFFFLIYLFLSPIIHHFLFNFCHLSLKILKFPNIHPFGNCFHFTSLNYFYCFAGPTHGPKEDFFFFFFLCLSLPPLNFSLLFFWTVFGKTVQKSTHQSRQNSIN